MASSGFTMDYGGPLNIPAQVRKTIKHIKEIVRVHSDADIFLALKECNMDPDETTQKLLNQDPFHVVTRRRDRKKEPQSAGNKGSADTHRHSKNIGQGKKLQAPSDHIVQRKNNSHNASPGGSRGFHVARYSRPNHRSDNEVNPSSQRISSNGHRISNSSKKGLSAVSGNQKPYSGNSSSQASNGSPYLRGRHSEAASNGINRSLAAKKKQGLSQSVTKWVRKQTSPLATKIQHR